MFSEKYEWPRTPPPPTIYRSKDHGKTWQVQETVIHPAKNGDRPTMHMAEHGITLRHGKHKGRLLRPARFYGPADTRKYLPAMYNTAIYSDDGGSSWQTSGRFPELGTGEGTVAELSDGRIYSIRADTGTRRERSTTPVCAGRPGVMTGARHGKIQRCARFFPTAPENRSALAQAVWQGLSACL